VFLLIFFAFTTFAQKPKVIFDCDLAGDVDDAYALALLLSNLDKIELLGIVTDQGLTHDRALVAAKMLKNANLTQIPIFEGQQTKQNLFNENTNGVGLYSRQMYWAKGFQGLIKQPKNGADFIIETLRKYPNQVTVITVGPIPNIGDVLKKDPEVLKLAKNVVSMFGSFYKGYNGADKPSPEYNVIESLAASQAFIKSGAKIVFIGLDVTDHVKLKDAEIQQLAMRQTPLTDAVSALYSLWRGEWGKEWVTPTLYDVVAVAYVLWPELFKTKDTFVEIDEKGFTHIIENKTETNCKVALEINEEAFQKKFINSLLLQNISLKH